MAEGIRRQMSEDDDEAVGYGHPPVSTRFKKGRSGNLKGRPRGRHIRPPYDVVLGRMVTITENGVEQEVTAEQAFLLKLTTLGLAGNTGAARDARMAIEDARRERVLVGPVRREFVVELIRPGAVNSALRVLRMATKLDRFRSTAKMLIEPWLVEMALARLKRRLSAEEQATIVQAVRTPGKVRWPDWWTVKP